MARTTATAAPAQNAVEPQNVTVNTAANTVGYHNIIKKLLADGAKRITSVQIKNVNFTELDNYTRISFTLTSKIPGYESKDDGATYEKSMVSTVYTSLYAIIGAMKEDEDLAWMGNTLLEKPEALNMILNGAKIDILQQEFAAGGDIVNPFSTRDDSDVRNYDHATIINNIVQFKLSTVGQKWADRLGDKLLGF